jgi:hypothetical protein
MVWLADTYDSLPDFHPKLQYSGTPHPVDQSWASPFVGKSIEDVANFIRNTPKPPKPLCKKFFALLQKDLYEKNGKLLICKVLPVGGEEDQDDTEEEGDEAYREHGRSLMCKVISDKSQGASDDEGDSEDEVEFEVQWIEGDAGHAETFFQAFERSDWWQFGEAGY